VRRAPKLLERTGRCELYSGSSCSEYLVGKYVFIKKGDSQRSLEKRISKWFETARSMKGVSDKCWPHAKVLMCFHTFPVCDSGRKLPANRQFCQDECHFLEKNICSKEFLLAKKISAIKQFVPFCETLPRPGTSAYSKCWKLPSLAGKPFVMRTINSRGAVTKRVAMKCFFKAFAYRSRNLDFAVKWYRNNTALDSKLKGYRIKNREKGNSIFVSTLIVRHARFKDAGSYECVATIGKASAKCVAQLTVVEKDDDPTDNSVEDGFGKCVPYTGQVCSKYLTGNQRSSVFEYRYSPQRAVEMRLLEEFGKFKKSKQFSDRCLEMSFAVMCFNVFHTCNKSVIAPAPRLCYEDCHLFDKVHCKYEVEMARKHSSAFELLPDCTQLPRENKLCKPMHDFVFGTNSNRTNGTKCYNGVGKDYNGRVNVSKTGKPCNPWVDHSPVYKFTHNYCRNFGGENYAPWCFVANGEKEFCNIPKCEQTSTEMPFASCYHDRGEDYRGQVKVSQSGKPCLQWNLIGSYEARHSYCRNYGGKKEAPWCYVGVDEMEYCDVPKCLLTAQVTKDTPSFNYYVIPVAVALTVLLIIILILLVYLKQRRKSDPAHHSTGQIPNGSSLVVGTGTQRLGKEDIKGPRVPGPLDKQVPEVNDCSVNFVEVIGKGCFIELWKAELIETDHCVTPLLVKRLSPDATKGLINAFHLEISTVRGLDHPNISDLLCVSRQGVVPFLGFGGDSDRDLKTCLTNSRPGSESENRFQSVDFDVLIDMAVQIANGLAYLHDNNIVHKDVGTRSCLVDSDGTVKVAHFGIGLYLHPEDYYHDSYITLPARWMSPETLQTNIFTKANDVWSLGVLIWELFSYADTPYGDVSDEDAIALINKGQLPNCPDACPASLYNLMKDCWAMNSKERISLGNVQTRLNSWNGTVC